MPLKDPTDTVSDELSKCGIAHYNGMRGFLNHLIRARSFYVTQGPLGRFRSWLLAVTDEGVHGRSLVDAVVVGTQHLAGPAGLGEWPGFEGVVRWTN